jgi:hypothetical protein
MTRPSTALCYAACLALWLVPAAALAFTMWIASL